MYRRFCEILDRLLRIPPPPEDPPGDKATVFRAAPAFFRYRLLIWGVGAVGPAIIEIILLVVLGILAATWAKTGAIEAVLGGLGTSIVLLFLLAQLVISVLAVRLDYEKRWYVLTDRSLRVREGVFRVREMTVTFANIQNITIDQGPIQRLFGIADLKVDTAGGGGGAGAVHGRQQLMNLHTARFRGVDNAAAIKELMQERVRGARDSGLGDTDDHSHVAQLDRPAPNPALATLLAEMLAEARALRRAAGG